MKKQNEQSIPNNYAHFQLSQKVILYSPESKKFLLLKDAHPESEYAKKYGLWDFPGGRVEKDEDLDSAFKREVKEEIGDVEYELGDVVYACTMVLKEDDPEDPYRAKIYYLATCDTQDIKVSKENSEYVWQTAEEIEKSKECGEWLKKGIKTAMIHVKANESTNDVLRIQADFENYKKRQQESQKELAGYLIEKLVLDIVPVLDNFRSATMHVPPEEIDSPWVKGIQYIEKQLETVLTDNGIQTIEVKEDEAFDPKIHEALEMQNKNIKMKKDEEKETESDKPDEAKGHMIAKVIQKGYKFGNRVIRPAKVIVK